jgi:hypothetical protein
MVTPIPTYTMFASFFQGPETRYLVFFYNFCQSVLQSFNFLFFWQEISSSILEKGKKGAVRANVQPYSGFIAR